MTTREIGYDADEVRIIAMNPDYKEARWLATVEALRAERDEAVRWIESLVSALGHRDPEDDKPGFTPLGFLLETDEATGKLNINAIRAFLERAKGE